MYQPQKTRNVALATIFLLLMGIVLGAGVDRILGVFTLVVGMFFAIALFIFAIEVLCWIIPPLGAFVPWKR